MKKNILILIAGLLLLGTSCSKDFLSVNEVNPNTPSNVEAKLVLTAALNMSDVFRILIEKVIGDAAEEAKTKQIEGESS